MPTTARNKVAIGKDNYVPLFTPEFDFKAYVQYHREANKAFIRPFDVRVDIL